MRETKDPKKPIQQPPKKNPFNFSSVLGDNNQSVVLKQPTSWSRGIVWGIIGVTAVSVAWAYLANIEQVVTAAGKLKPQGQVKEVQVPLSGVIKEVYVKDGQRVKQGQLLATLDTSATKVQLSSLGKVRKSLEQENNFYRTLMSQNLSPQQTQGLISGLKMPKEVIALVTNRISLQKENQLFQMQLDSSNAKNSFSQQEMERLNASRQEAYSRSKAAELEVKQQNEQLKQVQDRINNNQKLIAQDKLMLEQIKERNAKSVQESQKSLEIDKSLLTKMETLSSEGALGDYQVQKQRQQISDRHKDLSELVGNGQVEYTKQHEQLQSHLSELEQLHKERDRLIYVTSQAKEKLINAKATTQKDLRDKIGENNKKLAEIDSNLNKIIVENDKKIAETESQISQTKLNLRQQELRSPGKGIVFDLKASPGFVPNVAQDKPVLKIVPEEDLIAEVDVTNQDIGFVQPGQKVDVRIDTFPYSEFGDIKGQVISVGSDALPPDETHKFYRFPTKIKLNEQSLKINNKKINLQSGMAVTVNIKVKENRTVMSLFTGIMEPKVDSLKQVR
ncbi:MAG: HlyD family efflux transporter periplasmic adaptor subunit [Cyanobacteriota bacterium ELA615]